MATQKLETGIHDATYDLVSVLYHALKGAELYGKFADDCHQVRNSALGEFFRDMQEEERQRASRAKDLLRKQFEHE